MDKIDYLIEEIEEITNWYIRNIDNETSDNTEGEEYSGLTTRYKTENIIYRLEINTDGKTYQ